MLLHAELKRKVYPFLCFDIETIYLAMVRRHPVTVPETLVLRVRWCIDHQPEFSQAAGGSNPFFVYPYQPMQWMYMRTKLVK